MWHAMTASLPSLGDLSNFVYFVAIRDFLLADDGLITQWTSGMAQRLGELIAVAVLPMVTIWIMLAGYRIVTGQSREPMMGLVVDAARTSLIVFAATAVGVGNPLIVEGIHDLDGVISHVVAGGSSSADQIQESLGWMQFAFTSIDALPTGGDAALATAKERALWFTGIGTAGPSLVGGALLIALEIAVKFLTAIGPLAILCLLFKQTASIFQRWVQYCVGTLFRLSIVAVMTGIALKMVCAVAAAFWADRLINAAVSKLTDGTVDLQMAEGVTSMALQQGGLGLILTALIFYVPKMGAEFFSGVIGEASHFSLFGGPPNGSNVPGFRGQLISTPMPSAVPARQGEYETSDVARVGGSAAIRGQPGPTQQDVVKLGRNDSAVR